MATRVIMPQLGEAVIEGTVAQWLKQPGDQVELYEPLLEIETDKVTTEATAETAGTLLKILIPAGETVEVGTILAIIGEPGEDLDEEIDGYETVSDVSPMADVKPDPIKELAQETADTAEAKSDDKTVDADAADVTESKPAEKAAEEESADKKDVAKAEKEPAAKKVAKKAAAKKPAAKKAATKKTATKKTAKKAPAKKED